MTKNRTLAIGLVGFALAGMALGGAVGCGLGAVADDGIGARGTAGSTPGGRLTGKTVKCTSVTTRGLGYEPLSGVTVTLTAYDGTKQTVASGADGGFEFAISKVGKATLQFATSTGANIVPITLDSTPTQVIASVLPTGSPFARVGAISIRAAAPTVKPLTSTTVTATISGATGRELVWVMKTKLDSALTPTYVPTAPLVVAGTHTGTITVQALTRNLTSNVVTIKVAK